MKPAPEEKALQAGLKKLGFKAVKSKNPKWTWQMANKRGDAVALYPETERHVLILWSILDPNTGKTKLGAADELSDYKSVLKTLAQKTPQREGKEMKRTFNRSDLRKLIKEEVTQAEQDDKAFKTLEKPLRQLFDDIEKRFGELDKYISSFNAPGATSALSAALKDGLDRNGFNKKRANARLDKYSKR